MNFQQKKKKKKRKQQNEIVILINHQHIARNRTTWYQILGVDNRVNE